MAKWADFYLSEHTSKISKEKQLRNHVKPPKERMTPEEIDQVLYDKYYDCYLFPENQPLHFSTITREGYREYKSTSYICQKCPQLK